MKCDFCGNEIEDFVGKTKIKYEKKKYTICELCVTTLASLFDENLDINWEVNDNKEDFENNAAWIEEEMEYNKDGNQELINIVKDKISEARKKVKKEGLRDKTPEEKAEYEAWLEKGKKANEMSNNISMSDSIPNHEVASVVKQLYFDKVVPADFSYGNNQFSNVANELMEKMKEEALLYGADGIINYKLQQTEIPGGFFSTNRVSIIVTGTAVKLKKKNRSKK